MNAAQACNAIDARRHGVWDHPDLSAMGDLSDEATDIVRIKRKCLDDYGFKIGARDPRVNSNYPGAFMVVESHEASELPTKDGSNGPWCVVGDDLDRLIDVAFDFVVGCDVDGNDA